MFDVVSSSDWLSEYARCAHFSKQQNLLRNSDCGIFEVLKRCCFKSESLHMVSFTLYVFAMNSLSLVSFKAMSV